MSTELVTYAFQVAATSGDGLTQQLQDAPRPVVFRITGNGSVKQGVVTIERCIQDSSLQTPVLQSNQSVWTAVTTITVPADATTEYLAGSVSGTFRARISTPIAGGTVTVTAVRPEEQKGSSLRRLVFEV